MSLRRSAIVISLVLVALLAVVRATPAPEAPPAPLARPIPPSTRSPAAPEPPDEDDPTAVRCPLKTVDPVEGSFGLWVRKAPRQPSDPPTSYVRAELFGGALHFEDRDPTSSGTSYVTVPGYVQVDLAWTPREGGGFDCPEVVLQEAAVVVGTVHNAELGDDGTKVVVIGCHGETSTGSDGSFVLEARPGPCELRAERRDGFIHVSSPPVPVTPRLGVDVTVDLHLPETLQAGLGVRTARHELGFQVRAVRVGSPADLADLLPGDVIVAVDGVDAATLEHAGFSELTIGDVGTDVTVEVLADGRIEERVIRRRYLESDPYTVLPTPDPNVRRQILDPDAWIGSPE